LVRKKVAVVTVAGSIGSLKVAAGFLLTGTPVLVVIGSVETMVGAVASAAAPVKVHALLPAK
jgi:hypothetical protein